MRAGKLNHRCTLHRFERVSDEIGGWIEQWVEVRKFWGDVRAVSGRTWMAASQEQSEVTVEVVCRPLVVSAGMRITHGGATYEIHAPLMNKSRNQLQLMCKTVKPDA